MTTIDPHINLMDRFNKGEQEAFRVIFDRFYARINYFAFKLLQDHGAAEEIALDTFTTLFRKCADFPAETNIRAFLYISTKNACYSYLKKKNTLLEKQKSFYQHEQQNEAEAQASTEGDEVEGEVLDAIYRAVEKLPSRCKIIFKMIYYDGLKAAQVAEQLHISVNTVKNQRARAIQVLRNLLTEKEFAILLATLAILAQEAGPGLVSTTL